MPDTRSINTSKIGKAVKQMIFDASFSLPSEIMKKFDSMIRLENGSLAGEVLCILKENAAIAEQEQLPLCQDCGSVIVFISIGRDVRLEGEDLETAVNLAAAEAYADFHLRKSIVADPLNRRNTETNTPVSFHARIVSGKNVDITVYLKGGGSENMSCLKMFKPSVSVEEIISYIEKQVIDAGPNPCPPLFLGIGIGGTADTAVLNSKLAVLRGVGTYHPNPFYADLEAKILQRLNQTGVGVLGLGGSFTAAEVYIKEAPSHIASLPVALNMNCHSLRYRKKRI